MQEVRSFYSGMKLNAGMQSKSIEEQINEFLKEHPNHVAKVIEAYVIFDVRDEKKPQNGKSNGR